MTSYWLMIAATLAALFVLLRLIKWADNKILVGLLVSALLTVALLWLFYERFGVINLYIFCVSFFFDFIFIPLGLWAYARERKSRDESDKTKNLRDDWLAVITVVGFLFFYVAPVVGWGVSDLTDDKSWRALYEARVACAVVMPTIAGAALLPFVFRRPLLFYVPVVLLLTALPVWSGLNTVLDLYEGSRFLIIRHGCYSDANVWAAAESCFCNGKEVSCGSAQQDEEVFLLPHTRRVLRVEKSNILAVPGERSELRIGSPGFGERVLRGEVRAKSHPN